MERIWGLAFLWDPSSWNPGRLPHAGLCFLCCQELFCLLPGGVTGRAGVVEVTELRQVTFVEGRDRLPSQSFPDDTWHLGYLKFVLEYLKVEVFIL